MRRILFGLLATLLSFTKGIRTFWKFDADGTDYSGNGIHLTGHNTPLHVAGKVLNASEFNGTNYYSRSSHSIFTLGSGDWAFNLWIYPTDLATRKWLFGQVNSIGANTSISIIAGINGGKINASVYQGGSTYWTVESTTITANNWYNFTVQRRGNNLELFLGTSLVSSVTISGSINASSIDFSVGRAGIYASEYFIGKIDQFRYYGRSLTALELRNLNNGGNGR